MWKFTERLVLILGTVGLTVYFNNVWYLIGGSFLLWLVFPKTSETSLSAQVAKDNDEEAKGSAKKAAVKAEAAKVKASPVNHDESEEEYLARMRSAEWSATH